MKRTSFLNLTALLTPDIVNSACFETGSGSTNFYDGATHVNDGIRDLGVQNDDTGTDDISTGAA